MSLVVQSRESVGASDRSCWSVAGTDGDQNNLFLGPSNGARPLSFINGVGISELVVMVVVVVPALIIQIC